MLEPKTLFEIAFTESIYLPFQDVNRTIFTGKNYDFSPDIKSKIMSHNPQFDFPDLANMSDVEQKFQRIPIALEYVKINICQLFSNFPNFKKYIPKNIDDITNFHLWSVAYGTDSQNTDFFEKSFAVRKIFEQFSDIYPPTVKKLYNITKTQTLLEFLEFFYFLHPSLIVHENVLTDFDIDPKTTSVDELYKNFKQGHFYTPQSMEVMVDFQIENKLLPSKLKSSVHNSLE